MRAILAAPQRDLLEALSRRRVLLAFDYDGTLAPIAPTPARAHLRPRTRRLLRRLTALYPCIVVTGRSRADAKAHVVGLGFREVLGCHGLEPWGQTAALAERFRGWRAQLAEALAGVPGVLVEDKRYGLTVHYRAAARGARARAFAAAGELKGARALPGVRAVTILPLGGPTRGDAVVTARSRLGCDAALYVGDEEADEDVFVRTDPTRLVTVRVGRRAASKASYYVPDQRRVDLLLERLSALRRIGGGRPAVWGCQSRRDGTIFVP